LHILIVAEDVAASRHAQQVYSRLVRQLGDDFDFDPHVWEFGALADPELRAAAAQEAVRSDVIIIAGHGRAELPPHVTAWIQLWLGRNANPPALVALFGATGSLGRNRAAICAHLQEVARRGRMDFFCEPELPGEQPVSPGGFFHAAESEAPTLMAHAS
jgi:hypothetical protein